MSELNTETSEINPADGPPVICGARHPRGYTNVGPCQIYGEHDAHLFPHRAIAEGVVEIGFDTVNQRPIFGHRRWWRKWYDEPRAEWPAEFSI